MGPRHLSRGIREHEAHRDTPYDASMGPRHLSRGIAAIKNLQERHLISFNGATASEPWNPVAAAVTTVRPTELQWGHGI